MYCSGENPWMWPATLDRYPSMGNGSKCVIADMPEHPSSAAFLNSLTPTPIGEITPSPVTTTVVRIGSFRTPHLYLPEARNPVNLSIPHLQHEVEAVAQEQHIRQPASDHWG